MAEGESVAPAAAALALATIGSTAGRTASLVPVVVSFRCVFAGPDSATVSFFVLEDLVVRKFDFPSAPVLDSGAGTTVSSAILRVFFELLLDCMPYILTAQN